MTLKLRFNAKSWYFNSDKVIKAIGRARARFGALAGGMVRRTARQSLRYAKKAKPRPSPGFPRVRTKSKYRTLKNIEFYAHPITFSTIVGPLGINPGPGNTIPEVHEKGKSRRTKVRTKSPHKRRGSGRKAGPRQLQAFKRKLRQGLLRSPVLTRTVKFPPRPYMVPALKKNEPKFPALWRNSVK